MTYGEFDRLVELANTGNDEGDFVAINNFVKLFRDGEFKNLELNDARQSSSNMILAYHLLEEKKELFEKLAYL